ncbi:uncharacterized protein RCC_00937 [Ramularia collo-cygni]|uniref:PSI domain-containing protein n=1 Tax=Ramularia collo-cygni TaxID=112498 RepID=A0A2D3UPU4_9PEZI|nr:uncharacterized protein RCC_00937 [Ramularia collo-cygni]CZT15025.1 uncharacterized protein RCC_00937 [Ramularia collo-cygni]
MIIFKLTSILALTTMAVALPANTSPEAANNASSIAKCKDPDHHCVKSYKLCKECWQNPCCRDDQVCRWFDEPWWVVWRNWERGDARCQEPLSTDSGEATTSVTLLADITPATGNTTTILTQEHQLETRQSETHVAQVDCFEDEAECWLSGPTCCNDNMECRGKLSIHWPWEKAEHLACRNKTPE